MPQPPRLRIRDDGPIRIIGFLDRSLSDEATIRAVGDQLAAAIPQRGAAAVIVDFSGVDSLSSMMVGRLITLRRRVEQAGGRLRLTELSPTVANVFRSANLDRLFALDRDLRQSREALAGGAAS